ncbi:hypothetical protein [uncultured Winogradskyella sp.]|uniref:hypothetical protein n=1 Tax=uncultured Winogradskyella sp. TaxID=395353 RepID=UPI00262EBEE6|nr:hypothetical protein [uncultured Winogradskyella sp.]
MSKLTNNKNVLKGFSLFTLPFKLSLDFNSDFQKWLKKGVLIYLITVFLLFGVNFLWAWKNGRLLPLEDDFYYNFLEDIPNIINYLVICPVYISCGIYFINRTARMKSEFQSNGLLKLLGISASHYGKQWAKNILLLVLLFSVSFITITIYIDELSRYNRVFWFQNQMSNGDIALNTQGFYYLLTNLILNMLTVLVVISHFEFFRFSSLFGKKLKALSQNDSQDNLPNELLDKNKVIKYFKPYITLYGVSKILVVAYIANMYTWRAQNVDFVGILDFTILLIAVLAAALISYPRYHIQYWLYKVWEKNGVSEYPEIRNPFYKGLANVADYLILGAFMTNLVLYVFEKLGFTLKNMLQFY